jgi:hypothetical protein
VGTDQRRRSRARELEQHEQRARVIRSGATSDLADEVDVVVTR